MDIKERITKNFNKDFNKEPESYFSCGGRFEILGNHTDHNHGKCLAAACNLAIYAAVNKTSGDKIVLNSEGYPQSVINLHHLEKKPGDNSSESMIKGIAKYLLDHGYKVGGFIASTYSTIFPGAGVSSSAAFQLLVGQIFNQFYNDNQIDRLVLCKAGQYSENEYFGKKSGLLDQIGAGYGGISYIDFVDIVNPNIMSFEFPFPDLKFVIVNTGGSHASLNHLYSSIPEDMYNAAHKLGHNYLRETSLEELERNKDKFNPQEYGRALHFFNENDRVQSAIEALKNKDKAKFLSLINQSRISSTNYLKNMMVENQYVGSPLEACDYALELLGSEGAVKINGGGFAGSIICVVPENKLDNFIGGMSSKYGKNNVCEVFVRKYGPTLDK